MPPGKARESSTLIVSSSLGCGTGSCMRQHTKWDVVGEFLLRCHSRNPRNALRACETAPLVLLQIYAHMVSVVLPTPPIVVTSIIFSESRPNNLTFHCCRRAPALTCELSDYGHHGGQHVAVSKLYGGTRAQKLRTLPACSPWLHRQ